MANGEDIALRSEVQLQLRAEALSRCHGARRHNRRIRMAERKAKVWVGGRSRREGTESAGVERAPPSPCET
eukprot:scaffold2474_cov97-Isochrysis_galbana.AAC.3